MKTLLLFYPNLSSFIKKDIEILSKEYYVIQHSFVVKLKWKTPLKLITQLFFILKNIGKADVIVCEFASWHSLLPAFFGNLFRKPVLVIVGGMDCVSFPSMNYGNFNKKLLAFATKFTYKFATHIAPKHKTLMLSDYSYDDKDYPQQGIYYFCPGLKTPYTEIYNGYDSSKWYRNKEKKKNTFITVAGFDYSFQQKLKGIDLILEAAPDFPGCEFTILGVPEHIQLPVKSSNVKCIPPQPNEKLINFYSEAEFYMQLSMAEGFPNALCEAMLCECVPVVSNVFSMPEIIGESGFILKKRNIEMLKELISLALASDKNSLSKKAREKVEKNYTEEMRRKKLLDLLKKLVNYSSSSN